MNENILANEVQNYINEHINADVNKIALAKSPFKEISAAEIANQIAAKKKSITKLPTWYNQANIYYPSLLSIEQCSSEITAKYKSTLVKGNAVLDLTAGFGVDSFYFAKKISEVYSCEINPELATITQHNSAILGVNNQKVWATDGINFLQTTPLNFGTIYIDPARRKESSKVFKLKDCTPDVTSLIPFLLQKAERILIKTSPLLDISAGLNELTNVSEIHIISLKNECKELLWVIDKNPSEVKIICTTINETQKQLTIPVNLLNTKTNSPNAEPYGFLYEPDVALLKSGAFNYIANHFDLQKLHHQTQLYFSNEFKSAFLGRIFKIKNILSLNEFKKQKKLIGNVIVRNFPERADTLVKKFKITPSHDEFLIFTQNTQGYLVINATIIQHY